MWNPIAGSRQSRRTACAKINFLPITQISLLDAYYVKQSGEIQSLPAKIVCALIFNGGFLCAALGRTSLDDFQSCGGKLLTAYKKLSCRDTLFEAFKGISFRSWTSFSKLSSAGKNSQSHEVLNGGVYYGAVNTCLEGLDAQRHGSLGNRLSRSFRN